MPFSPTQLIFWKPDIPDISHIRLCISLHRSDGNGFCLAPPMYLGEQAGIDIQIENVTFSIQPLSRVTAGICTVGALDTTVGHENVPKVASLSVPNLIAALVEIMVQLSTTIFSQGPYSMAAAVFLNTIQSSAHSI